MELMRKENAENLLKLMELIGEGCFGSKTREAQRILGRSLLG